MKKRAREKRESMGLADPQGCDSRHLAESCREKTGGGGRWSMNERMVVGKKEETKKANRHKTRRERDKKKIARGAAVSVFGFAQGPIPNTVRVCNQVVTSSEYESETGDKLERWRKPGRYRPRLACILAMARVLRMYPCALHPHGDTFGLRRQLFFLSKTLPSAATSRRELCRWCVTRAAQIRV